MKKLDPIQIAWIVRQKEMGVSSAKIARTLKISTRRVQKIHSRHTSGKPLILKPGRPRKTITDSMTDTVARAYGRYRCSAVPLEKLLDSESIHMPHSTIHEILRRMGLASEQPKKSRRRKWIRYERTYSNSMWHTHYKRLDDGRWLLCYMDDASRFITGFGVFAEATGAHAILVLHDAIAGHGRPATILTDRGSQFYANKSEYKRDGASEFEKELVALGIRHILARVNHPQTNGKLERFHGEVQRKLRLFEDMDELIPLVESHKATHVA